MPTNQNFTGLSIPKTLMARLKAEATKEHRSASNLAALILEDALASREVSR